MKSKMNFFLSVLLVLLFGMGLNTYSLANSGDLNYRDDLATDLNINTLDAVFDYFISIQTTFGTNAYMTNQISSFYNSIDKTTLLNTIKAQITDDFGQIQNLVFSVSRVNNSSFYFYIFANNNTVGDLPHTRFYLGANGWLYNEVYAKQFTTLEDGTHQDLSNFIGVRFLCRNTGVMSVSNNFSGVFSDSSLKIVKNSDSSTANFGGILSLSPISSFYTITTTNTSSYEWLIASNYIDLPTRIIIPDEPDNPDNPDEPGESGTTGTITNPSGEETGKVDLSGIEQGIGAVKDAVNNVTNTIKDAFTFDSGDAQEVMQEFENTDLGLSQDLYDLNNQFFELFETEEMDDFKISWNGVNYQETQLIPSGELNFSAICRENEQIGKVKDYITLFAIVGASLTLLKVIWNMIAEMLGLNQTLMETDFGDAVMYTYEDNGYDIDTRAYLDHHYYTKGGRRH